MAQITEELVLVDRFSGSLTRIIGAVNTMSERLRNAGNSSDVMGERMAAVNMFTTELSGALSSLSGDAGAFGQAMADAMNLINAAMSGNPVLIAITAIAIVIKEIINQINKLKEAIKQVGKFIGDMGKAAVDIFLGFGRTVAELAEINVPGLISRFRELAAELMGLNSIGQKLDALLSADLKDTENLSDNLSKAFGTMLDANQIESFVSSAKVLQKTLAGISAEFVNVFQPLLTKFTNWLQSPKGTEFLDLVVKLMHFIGQLAEQAGEKIIWLFDNILKPAFAWFKDNIDAILQGIILLGTVAIAVGAAMALSWAYANLPLLTLIGIITSIVKKLQDTGVTAEELADKIGYGIGYAAATAYNKIGKLITFAYNGFVGLWNGAIKPFLEKFANSAIDMGKKVVNVFRDIFNFAMGTLGQIASAIDSMPFMNTDYRSAVDAAAAAGNAIADNVAGISPLELGSLTKLDDWVGVNAEEWGNTGADLAGKFVKGAKDLVNALDNIDATFTPGEPLTSLDSIGSIGKVGSVGKIEKDVNIADEDLKLLEDMAERRYIAMVNTKTLSPNMDITINNHGTKGMEQNVVNIIKDQLASEMVSSTSLAYDIW